VYPPSPNHREARIVEPGRKIFPIAVVSVLLPGRPELGCTAEDAEAFACGRNFTVHIRALNEYSASTSR